MLFFSFSNAGPSSSKWRFCTSGDSASALQARGDTCSVCDDEVSDAAESATGAARAIAVMNWNIFFIVFDATSSSRLYVKGNFLRKTRGILIVFHVAPG